MFPICLLQCAAVPAHYGQVASVGRDLFRLAFLSSLSPAETDPINLKTDPTNLNTDPINLNTDPINLNTVILPQKLTKNGCPLSHTYQAQLLKQKMEWESQAETSLIFRSWMKPPKSERNSGFFCKFDVLKMISNMA